MTLPLGVHQPQVGTPGFLVFHLGGSSVFPQVSPDEVAQVDFDSVPGGPRRGDRRGHQGMGFVMTLTFSLIPNRDGLPAGSATAPPPETPTDVSDFDEKRVQPAK